MRVLTVWLPPPPPWAAFWPVRPLGDVLGLGVVQLERLRAQRFEFGDLLLGFEVDLLLGRQFVLGRDPQHVAGLAHAQALALHDDVERLVPGHVLQAQRDVAGHGVAGHHVEVREVGDDLQQRANFDVLEVQRQLVALVARALCQLVRVDLHRPDLEHELVVGLVGAVFPGTTRLDHHAHAVTRLEGRHALHRCAEVGHVEPAAQVVGQRRAQELDHQTLPLLADVDAHLRAGQVHDDAPSAIGTTAEVDVAQALDLGVLRRCEGAGCAAAATAAPLCSSTISKALPCNWALKLAACFRFSTSRVRSPACATLTDRRLPWLISTALRPRALLTPGRSIATRGGACTENPVGTPSAPR
jgi:hypothetical protein